MSTPEQRPTHGYTKLGRPVHRRTIDHLPSRTSYDRFNKRLALWITGHVGTMTCFWLFCLIALIGLPAVLVSAHVLQASWVGFLAATGFTLIVIWVAQTFFQFVLLPAIMVGQNLQNEAADARAAKMFEDVESARECILQVLDLLDLHTEGGLKDVLDAVESLKAAAAG